MIVPVISIDYMYLGNKGEEKGSPILAGIDAKSGTMFAQVVPEKGIHSYAVKRLSQEIRRMGYQKIVLKSDQEPAIMALKGAVRNLQELEIIPEESPAYEHQSNGTVESAINRIGKQVRTMRSALEEKYARKIEGTHLIIPWMIRYAANVLSWYIVGDDGKTAYERLKGKLFTRKTVEFGECIWYIKAGSVGKNKMASRVESGVFLGFREESQEVMIGTPDGIVKAASIKRKGTHEERWNAQELDSFTGTPWEPIPGRGEMEIKTSIHIPGKRQNHCQRGRCAQGGEAQEIQDLPGRC